MQARYLVVPHEGVWKINFDNRWFGPFQTRDAAVAQAIENAREAGKLGHKDAEVLEMVRPGVFDRVWHAALDGTAQPAAE